MSKVIRELVGPKTVVAWEYADAPKVFQSLALGAGWVVFVPPGVEPPAWIGKEPGVVCHEVDGGTVYISRVEKGE